MASNTNTAVEVKGLVKSFRIPLESSNGVKQKLINALKGRKGYREFTPLNNVSFTIEKGDFFGIVGRNGSGKSTLLKTIAGIYAPDKGDIQVNGTLVPFIELGVGFNPELTGRENVFLNGALLGFSRDEMAKMYDDIVDFAELGDFMEERLKNYSSGMQVRLAFSIAIKAQGDILLLDEVLAVGDEAFQRKSNDYFVQLKREKRTVILVTHSMDAVKSFCNRAMLIHDGKVVTVGKPSDVARLYTIENDESYATAKGKAEQRKTKIPDNNISITVSSKRGKNIPRFYQKDTMQVSLTWKSSGVKYIGVALIDEQGRDIFSPNTFREGQPALTGKSITYTVNLNVAPGNYTVKAAVFGDNDADVIDRNDDGVPIIVEADGESANYVGVTELQHEWK